MDDRLAPENGRRERCRVEDVPRNRFDRTVVAVAGRVRVPRENGDRVAAPRQSVDEMRAHEAGAAGDEDSQVRLLLVRGGFTTPPEGGVPGRAAFPEAEASENPAAGKSALSIFAPASARRRASARASASRERSRSGSATRSARRP